MRYDKKLLLIIILVLGIGFAAVATTLVITGRVNISTNKENFDVKFTSAMLDGDNIASSTISQDGKEITFETNELKKVGDKSVLEFTITNSSNIYDANVSLNCISNSGIIRTDYYRITQNINSPIAAKTSEIGTVEVELLKASTEDIEESFRCGLTVGAIERTTVAEDASLINPHVKAVYRYNENGSGTGSGYTGCLGGEEGGCTDIVSEVTSETEYSPGDVIKYEVSPGVDKYFNVLYDKGTKLIMQQRENTIPNTPWYASDKNNTYGPTSVLEALETATEGWSNVNDQSYIMGGDTFGTGSFASTATGCTFTNGKNPNSSYCTSMKYPQFTKTNVKARMITAQEAGEMGCMMTTANRCKVFMNNYLYNSTSNKGSVNIQKDVNNDYVYGYWTASASIRGSYNYYALDVEYNGSIKDTQVNLTGYGARAVIEINK